MKIAVFGLLATAAGLLANGPSMANGDNLSFMIHNDSHFIISAFQSNEGHGWSTNWLHGDQVGAGKSSNLQFLHDGPCKIQVRVSWRTTDGGQEVGDPWNIDICKAKNVYFDGHKVTFD